MRPIAAAGKALLQRKYAAQVKSLTRSWRTKGRPPPAHNLQNSFNGLAAKAQNRFYQIRGLYGRGRWSRRAINF